MHSEIFFRNLIEEELSKLKLDGKPSALYDPIKYMIGLGGKRLRPVILLMCNDLFNGDYNEVIKPALGIEVFHNFTLLHDDIMDKAPLRRSMETVHKKWNPDIAILSGDTMFVQSSILMMAVKEKYLRDVLNMFFITATEVCEGQQFDMDFESSHETSIDDYINMIRLKTASLLGCSAFVGALCAGAIDADAKRMYEFGKNLGIAFQLHDDILDVYGDKEKFGKQIGGDIISNKKTFLLLTALRLSDKNQKQELDHWLQSKNFIAEEKINAVVAIYEKLGVREIASEKMDYYFRKSIDELDAVTTSGNKNQLLGLAEKLMVREK